MAITANFLEAPRRLRAFVRARESSLIVLAALIGAIGGLTVAAMSGAVSVLHAVLFNIDFGARLSSQLRIDPVRAIVVPTMGGLILGLAFLILLRWRPAREIDPIEANALHGGRMSFRGSVIVALQTIWSSGVGASVGLEAGYTQLSSGLAASLGRGFHLRRADQRIMVGCGAAAAIAGAFGAPLAGAFYAFELIIGSYTAASLAPVGVSAVTGYFVARLFAPISLGVFAGEFGDIFGRDLAIAGCLGPACLVLDKDRVRHALFGTAHTDYSRAQDDFVISLLHRAAERHLASRADASAILERTCTRAYQVADAAALAARAGCPLALIECTCPDHVARSRLARSRDDGHPAANRDFTLYQKLREQAEPITVPALRLPTDTPIGEAAARALAYLAQVAAGTAPDTENRP